jgi:hypothetical protein
LAILSSQPQIAALPIFSSPNGESTESLALAGNRVLVTGAGNPILDIGPLLAEPDVSIASLKTFAKLLTSARLEQGELCTLTGREWNEIWNRLRD